MPKRILKGRIAGISGSKTVSVLVERKVKHPLYGKIIRKSKKYLAHNDRENRSVGEIVEIQECRPISKRKTWIVLES